MSFYTELTKRELFKYYRLAVIDLNEANEYYNKGASMLHGINIVKYQRDSRADYLGYTEELNSRGIALESIPNVEVVKARITLTERLQVIKNKELQYLQQKEDSLKAEIERQQAPIIAGMLKMQEFMYNYDHNFIANAGLEPLQHLQSKFSNVYETVGAKAVMPAFMCELDAENKKKLFSYIICK